MNAANLTNNIVKTLLCLVVGLLLVFVFSDRKTFAISATNANQIGDVNQRPVDSSGKITDAAKASCQYSGGQFGQHGHYTGSYISDPNNRALFFSTAGLTGDSVDMGYNYMGHHCTSNMNGVNGDNITAATF